MLLRTQKKVAPFATAVTVAEGHVLAVAAAGLLANAAASAFAFGGANDDDAAAAAAACAVAGSPRRRSAVVSTFRAGQAVAMCVCILAVDFRLFPRRFAKTERFGVSLMDVGSGSVVFGTALAGAHSRRGCWSARRAQPLLALGLARLASLKLSTAPAFQATI